MSTLHESPPFALLMLQEIDGGNGLTITAAQTELFDNSLDAESQFTTCVTTRLSSATQKCYKVDFDHGEGVADLGSLLSLSSEVKKKGVGKRGLKNKGHRSALCRFKPEHITYVSKVAGSKPTFLEFDLGKMIAAWKQAEKGSRNYRDVDHRTYMQSTRSFTDDIRSRLEDVITLVRDETIKGQLQSILDGKTEHFFLQIMEYSSLPEDLEEELKVCIMSCKMYYYQALLDGKEFNYVPSDGSPIRLRKEDALITLGDPTAFPRLLSEVEIREIDGRSFLQVKIGVEGVTPEDERKTFWLTTKKVNTQLCLTEPKEWKEGDQVTGFEIRTSCISNAAQDSQKSKMNYDIAALRGLYCQFNDRILGLPFCPWDAPRNLGGIRAEIHFTDHIAAEKYMVIQCEKHRTDLTNAPRIILRLFEHLVGRIAKAYSHTGTRTAHSGITEWNLNEAFTVITESADEKKKKAEAEKAAATAAAAERAAAERAAAAAAAAAEEAAAAAAAAEEAAAEEAAAEEAAPEEAAPEEAAPEEAIAEEAAPEEAAPEVAAEEKPNSDGLHSGTTTKVTEHKRSLTKSRRDVITCVKAFREMWHTDELDEMLKNASRDGEAGLAQHCKNIDAVSEWMRNTKQAAQKKV